MLSSKELDQQSEVKIDKWLDINSQECKDLDPDYSLTKRWMKIGFEDNFLFTDDMGRIWGKGNGAVYFPFHFNVGKTLYGFRIAAKAMN